MIFPALLILVLSGVLLALLVVRIGREWTGAEPESADTLAQGVTQ